MIGATTIPQKLDQPFKDRFPLKFVLQPYTDEELAKVIAGSAKKLGIQIDDSGIMEVVKKANKTPRVANNLLRRIRDFATIQHIQTVDAKFAAGVLDMKGLIAVSG
jgi:holliday junction DNA helicase RuvB